jgi:hypothetical protein
MECVMHSQTTDLDLDPAKMIVGVEETAKHTPDSPRRVRWLISHHSFPVVKRGGLFYSHPEWIKQYYLNGSAK